MKITFTTGTKFLSESEKKSIEDLHNKVDGIVSFIYHKEHRPGGNLTNSMAKIRQGERIKGKAEDMRLAGKTYTKTRHPKQLKLNFVSSPPEEKKEKGEGEGMGFIS